MKKSRFLNKGTTGNKRLREHAWKPLKAKISRYRSQADLSYSFDCLCFLYKRTRLHQIYGLPLAVQSRLPYDAHQSTDLCSLLRVCLPEVSEFPNMARTPTSSRKALLILLFQCFSELSQNNKQHWQPFLSLAGTRFYMWDTLLMMRTKEVQFRFLLFLVSSICLRIQANTVFPISVKWWEDNPI